MKFRVTMKTPDALEEAIAEAVGMQSTPDAKSGEDVYCQQQDMTMAATELCDKWFKYGECLTVEIDTDAETCTVVEQTRK